VGGGGDWRSHGLCWRGVGEPDQLAVEVMRLVPCGHYGAPNALHHYTRSCAHVHISPYILLRQSLGIVSHICSALSLTITATILKQLGTHADPVLHTCRILNKHKMLVFIDASQPVSVFGYK